MASINFSIGGDNSKFQAVMRQTQAIGVRISKQVNTSFGTMAVATGTFLGGAALRVVSHLNSVVRSAAANVKAAYDLGGALSDVSAQTGMAAGNIRLLQQAFQNNGLAADGVATTINRMQRTIVDAQDGAGNGASAFARLGLSVSEIMKLTPDKQFQLLGGAINRIGDPTERAAVAMDIFGKSGGKLLTLFADTSAIATATREIGGAADILNSKAGVFDTISDKIANMVPAKMSGLYVGIADSLTEPLLAMLDRLESSDLVTKGQEIGKWIVDAAQVAVDSFSWVSTRVSEAQEGFVLMAGWAAEIANLLWDGLGRIGWIMQATWKGAVADSQMLVAMLAEGLAATALDLQTSLQFAFDRVVRFFDEKMGSVIDAIGAGLELAIQKAMEGLAKIPVLNKQLGLEGFTAESFGDIRERKEGERTARQSRPLKSYQELRADNFQGSYWMQTVMKAVEELKSGAAANLQKGSAALSAAMSADRAKLFDPQSFYDTAAEIRSKRESLPPALQIPRGLPTLTTGITNQAEPGKPLSSWQRLQQTASSWETLQAGKFGDRTSAVLGPSPKLVTGFAGGSMIAADLARKNAEKKAMREGGDASSRQDEKEDPLLRGILKIMQESWGSTGVGN